MAYTKKKEKDSSILDIKQLSERIKADDIPNLLLIYGEEDFFIDMSLSSIKKKLIEEGSESMDYVKLDFSGKDLDTETISQNVMLPPWVSSKRIVLVTNCQIPSEADELISLISNVPDSTVLIIALNSFDKRRKNLFNAFKNHGIVVESTFMDDDKLQAWANRTLSKNKINIDNEALISLISRSDSSMRILSSEVNKLILFCQGEEIDSISIDVIEQLCPPDIKGSVFNITDAVGAGDVKTALLILDNLIIMKEPPVKIRFMLMRHLKQLICARDIGRKDLLMSRLKIQSFVADKLIRQSNRFSMDSLIRLYSECSRHDVEIKHGNLNDRQALESFIVLACGCR